MPNDHSKGAGAGSLDLQLQALRDDVASLAGAIKGLAAERAADATRNIHERADDLLKLTKDAAGDATQRARRLSGNPRSGHPDGHEPSPRGHQG